MEKQNEKRVHVKSPKVAKTKQGWERWFGGTWSALETQFEVNYEQMKMIVRIKDLQEVLDSLWEGGSRRGGK